MKQAAAIILGLRVETWWDEAGAFPSRKMDPRHRA
jgi:hypothetical protein